MEQIYVGRLTSPHHLGDIGNGFHGSLRVVNGDQYLIGSSHGLLVG